MAEKIVLFDTNVLPRQYDFRSGFWLSILRLCHVTGHKPAVPEIVLHESVNIRAASYSEAANNLALATKEIAKYYGDLEVYVPDVESVVEDWRKSIEGALRILPLHGDDATEALTREALRRRPAREGKGGRDAAIWMTALRLAKDGVNVVFVSNNTKDFGKGGLHPDLVRELAELAENGGMLHYLQNLDDLVAHLATKIPPPSFEEADLLYAFEDILGAGAMTTLEGGSFEVPALDSLVSAAISLAEWKVVGCYEVDSEGLALISGRALVSLADGMSTLKFKFRGWVYFDSETTEVAGASLEEVTFDGVEDTEERREGLQRVE